MTNEKWSEQDKKRFGKVVSTFDDTQLQILGSSKELDENMGKLVRSEMDKRGIEEIDGLKHPEVECPNCGRKYRNGDYFESKRVHAMIFHHKILVQIHCNDCSHMIYDGMFSALKPLDNP